MSERKENKISVSLFGLEINADVDELLKNYKEYKEESETKRVAKIKRKKDMDLEAYEKRNEIDYKYAEKYRKLDREYEEKNNDKK